MINFVCHRVEGAVWLKSFFLSRLISRDNVQTFVSRGSRRKWLIIVGAVVLAGLITGLVFLLTNMVNYDAAKRHVLEKGMVSIGLRGDLAGFAVKDEESGVIKGYEADIAAEMERRLFGNEVKVDYQEINSKTGKVLLDLGDLDFSLAAYVPTDAETYVAYSDPYYTDAIVFYVRKGSGITSAQEINGKTVGVVNTSYAGYNTKLEEFLKGKNIPLQIQILQRLPRRRRRAEGRPDRCVCRRQAS